MTGTSRFSLRTASLGAVALVSAALVAVTPSRAAASYYEDGVSFSGRIVRGSIAYRLNLKAIEAMGFTYRLEVSISRLRDPRGSAAIRQRQTWTYKLEEAEFHRDGDTYRIDAGSEKGPFHVDLVVERRDDSDCSPHQQLFVTQPEGGAFRIETGNERFGTVQELPRCGRSYSYASGQIPGPPPCPVAGDELESSNLAVKERRGSDAARIQVYESEQREISGEPVEWAVELTGSVAARRFELDRKLRGRLVLPRAPWLRGTARFKPRTGRRTGEWYDCRGGREARSVTRRGAIGGDLMLNVIGSGERRVTDPEALAVRAWVRPRT